MQLTALKLFLDSNERFKYGKDKLQLIMAGSVRNEDDERRVESLRRLAVELGVQVRRTAISCRFMSLPSSRTHQSNVTLAVNVPYSELISLFGRASIGLHTMVDEHFGITVVEFQAAGLIPLVHASAGPLLDIVVPFEGRPTGFHAHDAEGFAKQLEGIVQLDDTAILDMRKRARQNAVLRFSTDEFERGWLRSWRELCACRQIQT